MARFIYWNRAACVGGILSIKRPFWENRSILRLLTFSVLIVLSYSHRTHVYLSSKAKLDDFWLRTWKCFVATTVKAGVASGNYFHAAQAVFFPLPWNCEVVPLPVNELISERAKLIFLPSFSKIGLLHMFFKFFRIPKATQIVVCGYSLVSCLNWPTRMTITSVSTVRRMTDCAPFLMFTLWHGL